MDTIKEAPFVSIVVCTLNRYDYIVPCVESLGKLTYPKDRYEVIVIDDGSTDATKDMASNGRITIVHQKNKGIPAARNVGIALAKGEIVAFIDDDAVADPHWLDFLVPAFEDPNISAAGGRTFAYKTDRILERYLAADEYGNPSLLSFGKSKNPLWRFFVYVKSMFFPATVSTEPIEVQTVFGLNCAYRASALKKFGGFDETLITEDDTELATRFRNHGAHIMYIPKAIVYHRHRGDLIKLIRQTYYRAEGTVYYYAKESKVLPVFPLPLFYIVAALLLIATLPFWGIAFILFGPVILYFWWPMKGISKGDIEYLVYPYIQLSLELAAVAGLLRGILRKKKFAAV